MMNLLESVRQAKDGDMIEIGRLTDCCKSMKELEEIAREIEQKNLRITSRVQPWVTSEVFRSLLAELLKIRNK